MRDQFWDDNFEKLKAYYSEHGNFDIPRNDEDTKKLYQWMVDQRNNSNLPEEKGRESRRQQDVASELVPVHESDSSVMDDEDSVTENEEDQGEEVEVVEVEKDRSQETLADVEGEEEDQQN